MFNAVLVVSVDIDLKETEKMIDYYFSAIPQLPLLFQR